MSDKYQNTLEWALKFNSRKLRNSSNVSRTRGVNGKFIIIIILLIWLLVIIWLILFNIKKPDLLVKMTQSKYQDRTLSLDNVEYIDIDSGQKISPKQIASGVFEFIDSQ